MNSSPESTGSFPELEVHLEMIVTPEYREFIELSKESISALGASFESEPVNRSNPESELQGVVELDLSKEELRTPEFIIKRMKEFAGLIPPEAISFLSFGFSEEVEQELDSLLSGLDLPIRPLHDPLDGVTGYTATEWNPDEKWLSDEECMGIEFFSGMRNGEPVHSYEEEFSDSSVASFRVERNNNDSQPKYDMYGSVLVASSDENQAVREPIFGIMDKLVNRICTLRMQTLKWLFEIS